MNESLKGEPLAEMSSQASGPDRSTSPRPPRGGALRSTLLISAATTASRLLGLVREQLFAILLGAGHYADAFVVAFRIPNLLRDLFAEGALSAAFVPTFTKVDKEQGRDAAHRLANRVIGAALVIIGALTLLGIVFARPLVLALASGFADVPGKVDLTARLAQIMMPFLPAISLAAVAMGMLNARGRFSVPALAPALFNVVSIGVGLGLRLAGASPQTAVVGWSIGTLVGGIAQFAVQLPPLSRDGFKLWPRVAGAWRDPALRRMAMLMAPATLGLAATQANIFINTQFASTVPGANAWLNYAFRLMYVPIGIFGVAIGTVTATTLARRAAEKDLGGMRAGLTLGMRHVAFLTVPSTIGLVVLREPLIGLIYQHGRFTAADTAATAIALAAYAIGLYAYSGVKVAAPAFYALDRPRVPLYGSAAAVLTNLTINLIAFRWVGFVGLAFGTSMGALVNLTILTVSFRRATREHAGQAGGLIGQLAKVALASALMGAAVWGALLGFDLLVPSLGLAPTGIAARLTRVVGGVLLGAGVYAAACRTLKVSEMAEILGALRRRRRR